MCTDVHGFQGYTFIKQKKDLHRPKTLEPVYKMILKPIELRVKGHSFVKQKWWTCINLKPPSKGALKPIGWNVIHLWNKVMDLHKPKTFKALSKMAFTPIGSKVVHDGLAQTLKPVPLTLPSLPFPSAPSKMGFEGHWEEGPFFHETKWWNCINPDFF